MEAKTFVNVFIASCMIKLTTAYYCEGDKCSDDEYCCGSNTCCTSYKVWELWYFWFGLCFFLILLSMCSCLWRYRPAARGLVIISTGGSYDYSPLHDDHISIHTSSNDPDLVHTRGGPGVRAGSGLPPYSTSQSHSHKISSPPPSYSDVVNIQKPYYHDN